MATKITAEDIKTLSRGRPKGSVAKRSMRLLGVLQNEHRFDVVGELIQMYKRSKDPKVQLRILTKFLEYSYPKMAALDISNDSTERVAFNITVDGKVTAAKQLGTALFGESEGEAIDVEPIEQ